MFRGTIPTACATEGMRVGSTGLVSFDIRRRVKGHAHMMKGRHRWGVVHRGPLRHGNGRLVSPVLISRGRIAIGRSHRSRSVSTALVLWIRSITI